MALKPEMVAALAAVTDDEQAATIDALHTAHDGEITNAKIKRGIAYICKKPSFFDFQRFRKSNEDDPLGAAKILVAANLVHPTWEKGGTAVEANALLLMSLASAAAELTEEDEEFDLQGN